MIDLTEFQKDLRNGMGVEDALQKHNTTLKEVLKIGKAPKKHSINLPYETVETYIYRRGDVFTVRKSIRSKSISFGTYNSLEDARRIRDYMIRHGWSIYRLDKACNELKINRR